MREAMIIAAIMGLGPAIALMFWSLRDYTYPKVERPFFDDRKAFLILAIGMVIGVVMYSIQSYFEMSFIVFALIFALLEESLKLMILNMPRFQRKLDTSFYGLTLGLGIGSTMAFGAVYLSLALVDTSSVDVIIVAMIISLQFVLLHASTGAYIGVGVARGDIWPYFAQATLVHLAYNMLMLPFFSGEGTFGYITFGMATVFMVYIYYRVDRGLLPSILKEALSRASSKSKN